MGRAAGAAAGLARRLAALVVVMLAVSVVTFLLLRLLPGDPAVSIVGAENATAENLARVRRDLRLDRPLPVQYGAWLWGVVRGDLGQSYQKNAPVSSLIGAALPVTGELTVIALLMSTVSVPIAAVGLRRRGGPVGRVINVMPLVLLAIPTFVLALLMIWTFSVWLDLLPASGWVRLSDSFSSNLRTAVLPASVLAAGNIGVLTRVLHGEMSSTAQQDFVAVARAKGLTIGRIVRSHILKPSLLPAITVLGLQVGAMLAGAVIVETVFAIPGIGRLLVESIYQRDLLTVQGVVLLVACVYVTMNTLVDVLYGILDPRTRRVGTHG